MSLQVCSKKCLQVCNNMSLQVYNLSLNRTKGAIAIAEAQCITHKVS